MKNHRSVEGQPKMNSVITSMCSRHLNNVQTTQFTTMVHSDTINASAKTVSLLLKKKYKIDVFQREYDWGREQIEQLISDLESKFMSRYREGDDRASVEHYPKYYMGSILISSKDGHYSIIDGQQRLTSITLLLIYINNLLKKQKNIVTEIPSLIRSTKFGKFSYKLNVDSRIKCMDALFDEKPFNADEEDKSVQNIVARYEDIENLFPETLIGNVLPFFIDWLTENVIFVEIETASDDDAYTIFETMNDRGLNLNQTDMLKGYLLSKLDCDEDKNMLNKIWKKKIHELNKISKKEDLEFFIAWFRSKYAESIRKRAKNAENQDFEKIGTRFHNWIRDNHTEIDLKYNSDYYKFINDDFVFYAKLYTTIHDATQNLVHGLEHVFYIAKFGVAPSFYYPMMMAPVLILDDESTINKKIDMVAQFLETLYVFRKINSKATSYNSLNYTIYNIIKEVRNLGSEDLCTLLKQKVDSFEENLDALLEYGLEKTNKKYVHYILARITAHIEKQSGIWESFTKYITKDRVSKDNTTKPFEIEHILADKFEEHQGEFLSLNEFDTQRNRLGALVLLPRGVNQALGDAPYDEKLEPYYAQNLLAKTLNAKCYEKNPSFLRYKKQSELPFRAHVQFKKRDIQDRQKLYHKICTHIWDSDGFNQILKRENSGCA